MTPTLPLPRRFRWMPGMRYQLSPRHPWCRYVGGDAIDDDGNLVTEMSPSARSVVAVPDLTDPATVGALAALVREAWGAPAAYAHPYFPVSPAAGWVVTMTDATGRRWRADTEGAAWWAALEDAP